MSAKDNLGQEIRNRSEIASCKNEARKGSRNLLGQESEAIQAPCK